MKHANPSLTQKIKRSSAYSLHRRRLANLVKLHFLGLLCVPE